MDTDESRFLEDFNINNNADAIDADTVNDIDVDPTSVVDPIISDPAAVVTRTRVPQIKLTSERLLCQKGLPFIMKNAPKRIRISKRKSNYDNLSNIVQFYQLWAHELFPKARFKDFIKLTHDLGKTDRQLREYRLDLLCSQLGLPTSKEMYQENNSNDNIIPEETNNESDLNQTLKFQNAEHTTSINTNPVLSYNLNTNQSSPIINQTPSTTNSEEQEDELYIISKTNKSTYAQQNSSSTSFNTDDKNRENQNQQRGSVSGTPARIQIVNNAELNLPNSKGLSATKKASFSELEDLEKELLFESNSKLSLNNEADVLEQQQYNDNYEDDEDAMREMEQFDM
ncbi:hypothetical protein TBLA_0A10180 [Henningerozyma blattae CBS 6284]|uniref:Chromosome segregation in meiosis protein n=1 Tax=Henningerozyma blattae (strain ATCC 34711 / CBS 6284 / DSM 70876 / NBRC 10599 / NRRL Y-10934 / UCD 77-7) TaxID=1071380 RepID=I2GXE5_HENB6|nr:hypothetical protein TBLA_0A10180 [Tetrapisispora blattae CBS 6284]CCH58797.1 hypothetical protein TBLA_0A10180 [Tetrapisispora blattae CBS 6284]